jgi:hypothetical protein
MGQYSAEIRPNIRFRFGLDVQLFGFGRIVKSGFRYITNANETEWIASPCYQQYLLVMGSSEDGTNTCISSVFRQN